MRIQFILSAVKEGRTGMNLPRIMIAGMASGSGKTIITCGLLQAFKNQKIMPVSSKCGPDYIDPMFHGKVLGIPSNNLDAFFCSEEDILHLFSKHACHADIAVIEGVMGYYDGYALSTWKGSSYDIARITKTPVLLVIPCKGMGLSIIPIIKGMIDFQKDSQIQGIILNGITGKLYVKLKEIIEQELPIKVCGYLPKLSQIQIESRHLGLITPGEISQMKEQIEELGRQILQCFDLDVILKIAGNAPRLELPQEEMKQEDTKTEEQEKRPRIGVAYDQAFCFYYRDNLELLESMGCELIYFSPLSEEALPRNLQGLLFGGGYPELYAAQLSANQSMRTCIYQALQSGVYCLAECGGFMYLQETMEDEEKEVHQMVGYLKGHSYKTQHLVRFGYIELEAKHDNFLQSQGERIKGHEFHYWDSTNPGSDYHGVKPMKNKSFDCCQVSDHVFAGYPHLYYDSNKAWIQQFVEQCKRRMGQ